MHPRSFSLDVLKTNYICKSCLASIRQPTPPPLTWPAPRFFNSASRTRRPPKGKPKTAPKYSPKPPWKTTLKRAAAREARSGLKPRERAEESSLPNLPPLRPPPELPPSDDDGKDVVIRYFNEEKPGVYRQLKDNEEFNQVASGLDGDVENSMNELEQQMEKTAKLMELMGQEQELENKLKNLRRLYQLQLQGVKLDLEGEETPKFEPRGFGGDICVSTHGMNSEQMKAVAPLNKWLLRLTEREGGILSNKDVQVTWKYFSTARNVVKEKPDNVPAQLWNFLWYLFSWVGVENPNRMHHLFILARDMRVNGTPLSASQHLLALEAEFIEGWESEAIDDWKRAISTLGMRKETFKAYWELGVRMCSHHGDPERARMAANKLIESGLDYDKRVLIPLVRAASGQGGEVAARFAWDSFQLLKDQLGESINISDYDEIIRGFLENNNVELALHVFVDMMFSGKVNTFGRTLLPAGVANKFFIGKWLKRIIGEGDLEGAYRIIAFVQDKGILLDAVQLNGLIGAWLRSGAADNLEKAEKLAWSLIRSRILFIQLRRQGQAKQWYERVSPSADGMRQVEFQEKAGDLTFVPKATLETFELLAENYQRRRRPRDLETLWKAFQQSEMQAESFMINQLIKTCLQEGERDKALEIYHDMTASDIPPDAITFVYLFGSLSVNRLYLSDIDMMRKDTVMARQIFAEMVRVPFKISPAGRRSLCRTILLSFNKLRDYAAVIAAARAMRDLMGFEATQKLILELAAGTADTKLQTPRVKRGILQATVKINRMVERRAEVLAREGKTLDGLSEEEQKRELHTLLEQVVRWRATEKAKVVSPTTEEVDAAAAEMGVYEVIVERDSRVVKRLMKPEGKPVWEA